MAETVTARIVSHAREIAADDWNACAGSGNPFLQHAFFTCLEDSGSAVGGTGWQPVHLVIDGDDGKPAAIMPNYLKSHSQGEYVFDHGWADAWARAGGRYYPKLQSCVPFTPATGERLLLRDQSLGVALLGAAEALTVQNKLSSAHATFIVPDQVPLFEAAGWLVRIDQQFHWVNEGYATFDDFLTALSSRKRKAIRKEREGALSDGITVELLTGAAITEEHWDAFWHFYQDTGSRKWGRPYLTRKFFTLLGERMADRVLLAVARRGPLIIAGALNLIGDDCLYGRYWGCSEDVPFLHFELCYYQAIDWAIANGRARVEAGAQGSHKLARGYRPTPTYSAHFIPDKGFRRAVADFLAAEREAVVEGIEMLDEEGPFRKG
ncbi:GNAT family N-acetyltransferase [Glacieibacterium megasporae]|uniref:GNAT family N-acetyltransferase n=1 Tax=Glacieibacterium megasporae TaxID=2835787 RepID=UPI001C1E0674|nr:GNAT family N-acetyltransferase [Polymorphobacter megasporae]UAJ09868.1 GNAT family N-acetyltransferase [Polymorphobacter megasporae]